MPTLTGTLTAITGGTVDTSQVKSAYVRAPRHRASLGSEGGLVVTVPVSVPTSGELSIDLDLGPAILVVDMASGGPDVFDLNVTEDMTLITEALAEAAPLHERSWAESQMVQLRAEAVDAAGEATGAAGQTAEDRAEIELLRANLVEAAEQNAAPHLTTTALNATYAGVDAAPTGTQAGDTAAVIAASQQATTEGRRAIRLANGHYRLDGLTPAQIGGCYLVGDEVSVTQGSFVYPFTAHDFAKTTAETKRTAGTRGRIAFEIDDALPEHWTHLFPATKRMGITMGVVWHTANGAQWITEAYRHGWEIIGHLPENITATTYLSQGQLDAAAQATVDAIAAITGTTEGIGFVYPQHVRSADTDRVLSKYFTRGRGLSSNIMYSNGGPHPWLTSAINLDGKFGADGPNTELRQFLTNLSISDSSAVLYMHYNQAGNMAAANANLEKLVEYIRLLGIEIVNPNQVWGPSNITPDQYSKDSAAWALTGAATRVAEESYHGTHAFKHTTPAGAVGGSTITSNQGMWAGHRPGMFAVYRMSFRYKCAQDVSVSTSAWGIAFAQGGFRKPVTGDSPVSTTPLQVGPYWPAGSSVIPAANWARVSQAVYVPPNYARLSYRLTVSNTVAGSVPIYFDDLRMDLVDYVPSVAYPATLNGTTGVTIETGVRSLSLLTVIVQAQGPTVGRVSYTLDMHRVTVRSSDAADTNVPVLITILPGPSYADMAFPATGA